MDVRDFASHARWWDSIEGRMAYMDDYTQGDNEHGEPIRVPIPIKMEVCPTCDGLGVYVNPNIDRQGLSRDDFDADPEFAESYKNREYNVRCEHCRGEKVIPWPTNTKELELVKERLNEQESSYAESEAERRMGA